VLHCCYSVVGAALLERGKAPFWRPLKTESSFGPESPPSPGLLALQGKYDNLTFWEQLDDGVQYSSNRKFLTAVPVVLFILASHSTDYAHQPLALNLLAVILLVIAKLPVMHKVRVLGINGGYV